MILPGGCARAETIRRERTRCPLLQWRLPRYNPHGRYRCSDGNSPSFSRCPAPFSDKRILLFLRGSRRMNLSEYIEGKRDAHLAELCEFLRIPSVSTKSEHKPDIERAAQWVADKLRRAGMKTVEIVPTRMHPLVYGESLEAWTSPAFEPAVRDGNLFGRGTADDKGQVHIHLKALESLRDVQGKLP